MPEHAGGHMLYAMLTFVGLDLLGDVIVDSTAIPVPGMVVGLLLLFGVLCVRGRMRGRDDAVPDVLNRTAKALHDNLGLLFVPAGAGILANKGGLAADGAGLLVAVLVSTLATIAITALVAGHRTVEITASGQALLQPRPQVNE